MLTKNIYPFQTLILFSIFLNFEISDTNNSHSQLLIWTELYEKGLSMISGNW